ncbi:MAG: DEAD/DEAH box helicase [Lachnospiraceae bacterium]|nr:DEAD/DEAH box helicase [Lachnospiraceae bacterium]
MFSLTDEKIKDCAMNEVVYSRGIRYYRKGTVSNVVWSKTTKQFRANVQGKNKYLVTITPDMPVEGEFTYTCNCPDSVKRAGACKHVIAALLFIQNYLDRTQVSEMPKERQMTYDIIDYFEQRNRERAIVGDVFSLKTTIRIPKPMKKQEGNAYVSLSAGNTKFYKVQNIKHFLEDVLSGNSFKLGKEFQYIESESTFTRNAKRQLEFLTSIYEVQERTNKSFATNLFVKNEISLTQQLLQRFLQLLENTVFTLQIQDHIFDKVTFARENPKELLSMEMNNETISIQFKDDTPIIPLTLDGALLFYDNVIYQPDRDFVRTFRPFYHTLETSGEPIVFLEEDRERFLSIVLPGLFDAMEIAIPEEFEDRIIEEQMQPRLYLDRQKKNLVAKLIFGYGPYDINPRNPKTPKNLIVVRKKKKEGQIISMLEDYRFSPYKDGYILKDADDLYKFLVYGMDALKDKMEVFYSDAFRDIRIREISYFSTAVRLNTEVNLLEVDFAHEDIPKEELRDIFHSLELRKKYHRLKNGDYIDLKSVGIQKAKSFIKDWNLSYKDISDHGITVSVNQSVAMKAYLDETDNEVVYDGNFLAFLDKVLNPELMDAALPDQLTVELRGYQKTGYRWLLMLESTNLGGILADDMGLGKTLEAITYMLAFPEKLHLVVCPTSLVYNWLDEIENFTTDVKAVVVTGPPEQREQLRKEAIASKANIIITSYPLIRRDYKAYMKMKIHTVFADEAQFIKNPDSLSAKSIKKIPANHRFALTGTPIENSLTELWSIFDFVMPGYLDTYSYFRDKFERPIVRMESKRALRRLEQKISPFVMRRMKEDVLPELPDKIETKLVTELTEKQKELYLSYLEQFRRELYDFIDEDANNQIQILSALTRLRQICCHPSTFVNDYEGGSGKLELLMEQLPGILENKHRVLIFSQFTSMLSILEERLKTEDISYFYLDGTTGAAERRDMIGRFNEGEREVFLISLKAGGTGVNLTGADTVIHYDPWWNPAVEEQATDRIYRMGQKNTVHVIRLLTKGTIEEKIYKMQKKKEALSAAVVKSKEVFLSSLTKDEIKQLFEE